MDELYTSQMCLFGYKWWRSPCLHPVSVSPLSMSHQLLPETEALSSEDPWPHPSQIFPLPNTWFSRCTTKPAPGILYKGMALGDAPQGHQPPSHLRSSPARSASPPRGSLRSRPCPGGTMPPGKRPSAAAECDHCCHR